MRMENIFPTPVGFFKYEKQLSEETLNFLKNQERFSNELNSRSKNTYILKQRCLYDLTTFIENCVHEYFMMTFNPKNDVRLKLTQSWLNYSEPGQAHHSHAHPSSLISGCYYVNANKETDKIFFINDKYRMIKFPPIEWNLYNSESWWFPVGTGDIVLFPSSLIHKVETVQSKETRISLAFNTFPVGHIGDEEALTALHI